MVKVKFGILIESVTGKWTVISAGAARKMEDFVINDLSNCWLRRSPGDSKNPLTTTRKICFLVLRSVLLELSKLLAPFTPFIAEEMYMDLHAE